ncbi:MAG: ribonuclease domain-containing protein [Alphaproteobacteria bacterium]
MQRSQLNKLILTALILGGAWMGWIEKSTFDRLLNGEQPAQVSQHTDDAPDSVNVDKTLTEAPTPTSIPNSNQTLVQTQFVLPDDRGEICASDLTISGPQDKALYNFAKGLGLSYPETFVRVSNYIHENGRLPNCYMSKGQARDRGWSGGPLWSYAPGRAIGGNRFGNREGRLPSNYNGSYIEADLDYDGRRRGADRLLFVKGSHGKWLQWVTVNHYDSFHKVPQGN